MGDLEIPADYDFLKDVLSLAFISEIFEVLIVCILNAKYYIHNRILLYDYNIEFLNFFMYSNLN